MPKMGQSRKMDMLSGPLAGKIIAFALPLAASSILQQLFNAVDVAVVGHFAANQAQATAAVGCNGPVINLIVNLFVGVSVGANVVVSGFIGHQDREGANRAVHSAMAIALASGFLLLFVGLAVSRPILELMDTPEDVLPYAVEYLRIYSIGMPVIMVYNFGSAILRCIGDTRRPLYCLTLSGVINAILNIIMVVVFHLDVAGVAIATVASNAVSAGLVWHFLTHEESEIRLDARKLRIDTGDMKRIMAIGLPAGLQSMVFSVSNVIIQSVLNGFGTNAVAGSAVALNYENFTYFVVSAFCQAVVTFTSQNFGAGQYRRCNRIFRLSMLFAVISAIIMSWAFILGRGFFTSVFTDDPEVGRYARLRICIVLGLYFVLCSYEISGSALRGLGHSLTPAVLTVFGTCVFRLFWVWVVCRIWPRFDVLLAVYPISWVITGTAVLSAYFIMRDKAYRMHHALSPQL